MRFRKHIGLVIGLLLEFGVLASATAGKLYRWVDEDGNVQFSDQVPPSAVRKERAVLDERGLEVNRVEQAKTAEQLAQEAELERLRKEKQRLIEAQEAEDRVLLRSFRSVDDIALARDGKLAAVDVLIQVAKTNNKRLKAKLVEQQKAAAAWERSGRPVPLKTQQNFVQTQNALKGGYALILQHEDTKHQIRDQYNTDIERFRALKNLAAENAGYGGSLVVEPVFLPNVYTCPDAASCDRSWQRAEEFTRRFATTPVRMMSDQVIMTAPPMGDKDIAITVARLEPKENEGTRLFLDVQCRDTDAGKALCRGKEVQLLLHRFQPYMKYEMEEQAGK